MLNGQKRWITNGGIAQVLTVMARTPVPGSKETKITAFLVTPDMPGFEVVEKRMAKCGVRGTATVAAGVPRHVRAQGEHPGRARQGAAGRADGARFRPHHVRRQLHRRGQVLRRAGRAACANRACSSAQPLANFELVKEKLAYMQAGAYAMEAVTYRDGRADRLGRRRLHARNGHAQGLLHRRAVADHQRHDPDLRRQGLLHRRAVRADDARRADQHDRRRGQRRAAGLHGPGRHARRRAWSSRACSTRSRRPLGNLGKLGGFAGRKIESLFSSPDGRRASRASSSPTPCGWAS